MCNNERKRTGNFGNFFRRSNAMKTKMCIVLMLVAVLTVMQSANAVLITNGASTVFDSAGFENASQTTPYRWGNPSNGVIDADPDGASIGSWAVVENSNMKDVQVVEIGETGYDPFPYSGDNYLRIYRPAGGETLAAANFAPQTSGSVHCEFMYNADGGSVDYMQIRLSESDDNTGWPAIVALATRSDGKVNYYSGSWKDTGLTYDQTKGPAGWQKWEIDYIPGASTFTFAIDGVSSSALNVSAAGNPGSLIFRSGGAGGGAYVDAVPEPATIALLSLGGLLLRRRKA